ncbi:ABC transporter substrate-binding protein [Janibacter melonis]|uniref:ABC transporter substrate-binding protein n=1 Tax=Janibacter melonis TaxID=262209 RepID=A0A176QGU6_9MICO|nr:ABC transporter substrate-binding protein [Janibacter melonis]MBD5830737.1 ABC transporter substrate-binding protein [Janibacter melonis]MCB5992289.1 ABC transporter substrate-binding protein [Janibacter melonis]OAB89025.1 ABC transporter substrate-binding protein [Janibacter melonis]
MRRAPLALAACFALTTSLAACGSDSLEDPGASGSSSSATESVDVKTDDELAAMVPAEIKEKGTISVGSDASYAPNEFLADDGKTVEGMDVDLFDAVATKLGLETKWSNGGFDTLIAGISSGKYDVSVSSFTINDERKKQVNMISYFDAGTQWVTTKGNPNKVDPDNACGMNIGVQKGTVQVDDLEARSKKCEEAGEEPIKSVVEQEQSKVTTSLASGKVDAMLADSPIALYAVKQQGDTLEALGDIYDSAPYGIVVPKDQTELADAIAEALKSIQEDGTYETILKNWGNESGAIDDFAVNP